MTEVLTSDAPLVRTSKPVPMLTALAIGAAAILTAGAGVVTVGYAGGGQQPEDVLPASAVAVMKIDLDPSLDQKKAVYEISRKFHSVKTTSEKSIRDDLLSAALQGQDLDYNRDVKPWLGDRAAVAAVPDSSPDGFAPVAAVQYKDKSKAEQALKDAKGRATSPFAYAFSGDYVLVADTQSEVDSYAKADKHLSGSDTYNKAVDALGGDQLMTGWADVKGVYDALPETTRKQFTMTAKPAGSFVVGAHADAHYIEVRGKAVDVGDSLQQYGSSDFGGARSQNLIAAMPADATAVMEATGLGDSLTKGFDALTKQPQFAGLQDAARQYGLTLPADLRTVFGTDLAVALFGDLKGGNPSVASHVLSDDPAGAVRILNSAAANGGQGSFVVQTDGGGGYFIGTSQAAITHITGGTLGDTAPFKQALPDAKGAGFALYVSIGRAMQIGSTSQDLSALEAFGMTANRDTGEFRMRLTFS